ncbi:hypothetical protein H6G41_32580 [Tolypothrix sp. FACHB-123]|uniref:hypothetical protein n=1 Tax=Tolypothrix sp. FACHB-123 TaxID=2692868 RepID=UPI001683BDA3|nr:hypothetical protein [Tolypothrix sp. FACHB-123]MBD2359268.1 hypothetical protein [Tolypothrix sp. FACHB-123]
MDFHNNLLFYPEIPDPRTIISKICQRLGYTYSNSLEQDYLLGFKWKDTTYYALDSQNLPLLSQLQIFNSNCIDISKNYVYKAYSLIFGNTLAVDPLVFSGAMVSKSNRNATHDGAIIQGPIAEIDSEKSYCILVDNSDGNDVIDYRVPIFLDTIPLVYIKRREIATRFENVNLSASLVSPEEVFSIEEIHNLIAFANEIGMEYGELDVLRDRNSQKIYVVDANNTPFGPPKGLSEEDSLRALTILCNSFEDTFITQGT